MENQPRQFAALDAGREDILRFVMKKVDDVEGWIIPHGLGGDIHVGAAAQDNAIEAHEGMVSLPASAVDQEWFRN